MVSSIGIAHANTTSNQSANYDGENYKVAINLYNSAMSLLKSKDTTEQQKQQGFDLLMQSAQLNYSPAIYEVGQCYFYGRGVTRDKDLFFKYTLIAAQNGLAIAQYQVGISYLYGKGVIRNKDLGFGYLLLAADQGVSKAQYQVGMCFLRGTGIQKNEEYAKKYLRLAAANGHERALIELRELNTQ